MRAYALVPQYINQGTFSGNAIVVEEGDNVYLNSYETLVCTVNGDQFKFTYYSDYSKTTIKHVNEFLRQYSILPEDCRIPKSEITRLDDGEWHTIEEVEVV